MIVDPFKVLLSFFLTFLNFSSYCLATNDPVDSANHKFINWYNKDPETEKIYGIGTDKAYKELLKGKKSQPVVVAVIDTGVDIDHEDLKSNIWINENEIPDNNIDDDQNGYVDDIHGWNFLGNSEGENITYERLEITRNYARLRAQFEGVDEKDIAKEEKAAYQLYLSSEEKYLEALAKAKEESQLIKEFGQNFYLADGLIATYLEKENYTLKDLKQIDAGDDLRLAAATEFLISVYGNGLSKEELKAYEKSNRTTLNFHLNPDFNPRPVVGDDPDNTEEYLYGNNDVTGEMAEHGTHVAGIIAAIRDNGLGIDGIADNVRIMVLRAVPDGDERDKDIANAIKYAVNNGAQIINMSFGKGTTTHREAVEDAIRYCAEKGVLLVHAAGNEAIDLDKEMRYPTNSFSDKKGKFANFINVGATTLTADHHFIASFTNYGRKTVDIFAPGVDIYSLAPGDNYQLNSGSSMASPMVTGLAALLMSYYPSLDIMQIKDILYQSASNYDKLKVFKPNRGKSKPRKVKFASLSNSGGVINAYKAVKIAEEMSNKELTD